ncbi:MAG: hypothetical protein EOP53_27020 [Sphingobacteriales bacterium]|nr:MAG: hypothetical protein EOP53_27020 [Sphingobacteriales bacterium]
MTWTKELKMPYTERQMDVLDSALDKESNAYILAKVFHDNSNSDKKKKKDKEANYHIELFRISQESTEIGITKVEIKDKFVQRLWLYESPDNFMVCAGLYNNGKDWKGTDGFVIFKMKKEGGIYDSSFHEIPVQILNDYVKNKTKKKNNDDEEDGEAQLQNFVLNKLQINSDGSLILMGEQFFIKTVKSPNDINVYFHYHDILAAKIDPAGRLAWITKIPKKQVGRKNPGGMSYKHLFANNKHYFLFLDNVKNYNLPPDEEPSKHSDGMGGYLTSYKVDDITGERENSSVFNVRDIEEMTIYQFATNRIVKTGEDEFIVEVYKKKKEDVMIKVKMKK